MNFNDDGLLSGRLNAHQTPLYGDSGIEKWLDYGTRWKKHQVNSVLPFDGCPCQSFRINRWLYNIHFHKKTINSWEQNWQIKLKLQFFKFFSPSIARTSCQIKRIRNSTSNTRNDFIIPGIFFPLSLFISCWKEDSYHSVVQNLYYIVLLFIQRIILKKNCTEKD